MERVVRVGVEVEGSCARAGQHNSTKAAALWFMVGLGCAAGASAGSRDEFRRRLGWVRAGAGRNPVA